MIRCRWLVPAAALCAVLPARSDAAPWNGRLPASPSPRAQSLSLVLDPGRTGYEGTTRIELDVATTVDRFVLHSEGLELTRASLMRGAEVRSARTRAIADSDSFQDRISLRATVRPVRIR